jgi:hypothetical protein
VKAALFLLNTSITLQSLLDNALKPAAFGTSTDAHLLLLAAATAAALPRASLVTFQLGEALQAFFVFTYKYHPAVWERRLSLQLLAPTLTHTCCFLLLLLLLLLLCLFKSLVTFQLGEALQLWRRSNLQHLAPALTHTCCLLLLLLLLCPVHPLLSAG